MRCNRQAGLTIPLVALFMVVLIVMMALAIDLGVLYTARTSVQHAADAGALAGAFTYVTNPYLASPGPTATAAAIAAATQNKIFGVPVPQSEVTVTPNPPFVTVNITHIVPTFFAKVIGQNQATVAVTATAQGGTGTPGQAVGTTCLRPFWITRSSLGSCSSTPTPAQILTLHNSTGPSQWGFICEGGSCSCGGGTCNWSGGGASAIKAALSSCVNVNVNCGDPLTVETGDISAIANMQNNPPPPEFLGPNPDYFYGIADYALGGASGPISPTSQSVISVAVLDDCNGQTVPGPGGNQALNVNAFAYIFLGPSQGGAQQTITGNGNSKKNPLTLNGRLITFNSCGTGGPGGGSGGGSGNSGNYPVPVRLVQ
jgi:Flp pilus assembly protein TadG